MTLGRPATMGAFSSSSAGYAAALAGPLPGGRSERYSDCACLLFLCHLADLFCGQIFVMLILGVSLDLFDQFGLGCGAKRPATRRACHTVLVFCHDDHLFHLRTLSSGLERARLTLVIERKGPFSLLLSWRRSRPRSYVLSAIPDSTDATARSTRVAYFGSETSWPVLSRSKITALPELIYDSCSFGELMTSALRPCESHHRAVVHAKSAEDVSVGMPVIAPVRSVDQIPEYDLSQSCVVLRQARSISATLHAWAMQPRAEKGGSPS